MKVDRDLGMLHPILKEYIRLIQVNVITKHNAPFKLFETGRSVERHQELLTKGKTQDGLSSHLYRLDVDVPLYATAVDYVYYDTKWSWNLRDSSVFAWYQLFGNLVLDVCPGLDWGGLNRKSVKYDHFQLRKNFIVDNIDKYPCTLIG